MAENILVETLRKSEMTAGQMKLVKLNEALKKYEISKDIRRHIKSEFSVFGKINFTNMDMLAAAIAYLESIGDSQFGLDVFKDKRISQFLFPLLSEDIQEDVSSGDYSSPSYIAKKADLLRYINAVIEFRSG